MIKVYALQNNLPLCRWAVFICLAFTSVALFGTANDNWQPHIDGEVIWPEDCNVKAGADRIGVRAVESSAINPQHGRGITAPIDQDNKFKIDYRERWKDYRVELIILSSKQVMDRKWARQDEDRPFLKMNLDCAILSNSVRTKLGG